MQNLYDRDLVKWSEQQARALRAAAHAGANAPIDWINVAEEIESLAWLTVGLCPVTSER